MRAPGRWGSLIEHRYLLQFAPVVVAKALSQGSSDGPAEGDSVYREKL